MSYHAVSQMASLLDAGTYLFFLSFFFFSSVWLLFSPPWYASGQDMVSILQLVQNLMHGEEEEETSQAYR